MLRNALTLMACLLASSHCIAQVSPEALGHKEAGNHFLKERRYAEARGRYLGEHPSSPHLADAERRLVSMRVR